MDVDGVPAGEPPCSPAGSGSATATEALGAADAATRIGIRSHPVVRAAILSDFVVRAMEIAAAINRGRRGNLDRPLIRTLARDLGRDLDRAREYSQVRHVEFDLTGTGIGHSVLILTLDQASERYVATVLIHYVGTALRLARELGQAIDSVLARQLKLRLSLSRDHDLELACELAAGLDSTIDRALDLGLYLDRELVKMRERTFNVSFTPEQIFDIDRSLSRTLVQAFERPRALDRVCAQGVAGRLGISPTEGLADALLDGAMDDFTSADLTYASLADSDLTGVRWSLSGTIWPPETDVKALVAQSEEAEPGSGILVVTRRGRIAAKAVSE